MIEIGERMKCLMDALRALKSPGGEAERENRSIRV